MKLSNRALAILGAGVMLSGTLVSFNPSPAAARSVVESEPPYAAALADASQGINDTTLHRAAKAYVKLTQIEIQRRELLNGANRYEARARILKEIESEKLSALESEGLQPQEYNQILKSVESNTDIREKFHAYVDAARASTKSKRLWLF